MKLEYIALADSVDRIVRRKPSSPTTSSHLPKTSRKDKGKGKAISKATPVSLPGVTPSFSNAIFGNINSTPTWEAAINGGKGMDWESSDDEDGEDDGSWARGLRLETVEGCAFWNISGVRIFEKDVLTGAL